MLIFLGASSLKNPSKITNCRRELLWRDERKILLSTMLDIMTIPLEIQKPIDGTNCEGEVDVTLSVEKLPSKNRSRICNSYPVRNSANGVLYLT